MRRLRWRGFVCRRCGDPGTGSRKLRVRIRPRPASCRALGVMPFEPFKGTVGDHQAFDFQIAHLSNPGRRVLFRQERGGGESKGVKRVYVPNRSTNAERSSLSPHMETDRAVAATIGGVRGFGDNVVQPLFRIGLAPLRCCRDLLRYISAITRDNVFALAKAGAPKAAQ